MARVAALKADLAMLEGTGGTQIKGLITYSGIAHAHGQHDRRERRHVPAGRTWPLMESEAAGRGGRPDGVGDAEGDVRGADEPPGRRGRARPTARGRSCSARRADAADAPPAELYGTRVVRSSQVSATRTKGGGTNLTYILLGYFPDWIVARLGVMEFLASGLGDTALQNDRRTCAASSTSTPARATPASFVLCDQLVVA